MAEVAANRPQREEAKSIAEGNAGYMSGFGNGFETEALPGALPVGGFGRMSWVPADEYARAEPDPLRHISTEILAHMNDDHEDALVTCARALANVADATTATRTRQAPAVSARVADGTLR